MTGNGEPSSVAIASTSSGVKIWTGARFGSGLSILRAAFSPT
jgi:hypothetical protein